MRLRLPVALFLALLASTGFAAPSVALRSAEEAAAYLKSVRQPQEAGVTWPADALVAGVETNLESGSAGVVLFYLALHDATGNEEYLREARAGADHLVAAARGVTALEQGFPPASSFYYGWPGVAWVLRQVHAATGAAQYAEASLRIVSLLDEHATRTAQGVHWTKYNDVLFGAAGTGLFLIDTGDDRALHLARDVAASLLARRLPFEQGLWKIADDGRFVLPNFSHGAAGISFFLARLHQRTGAQEYLAGAITAARYIESIAQRGRGVMLVPYGFPDRGWARPHDLGWAHGVAGTARLFHLLHRITGDARWKAAFDDLASTLAKSGMLGSLDPVFGEEPMPLDVRFGLAGIAQFLLDTGDVRRASPIVERVMRDSVVRDGRRHWPATRQGFMPDPGKPAIFTGYFYGNAGYGLLLLQYDTARRGREWKWRLPDNPFGAR